MARGRRTVGRIIGGKVPPPTLPSRQEPCPPRNSVKIDEITGWVRPSSILRKVPQATNPPLPETLPRPGGGEMNYPLLISEIRKLNRPLNCIIEQIQPELAVMSKTKAWDVICPHSEW